MAQSPTISHDLYWSVRPLSILTFNPNFQIGKRLPCKDSANRIYGELSFTYPYGKTFMSELGDISFPFVALQVENRLRFVNRNNTFIGPVFEMDYRRYSYYDDPQYVNYQKYGPDVDILDLRLGFEHGKYFVKHKRNVKALYWGLALRYSIDFQQSYKNFGFGTKDSSYLGLKLYLNWQIGGGFKAAYPKNYTWKKSRKQ